VLPGVHRRGTVSVCELAQGPELYYVFYNVRVAVSDGDARFAAHCPVPEEARAFPLMRWYDRLARTWKLWDGETFIAVSSLTPEQQNLSLGLEIWGHNILVHRIEQGWLPKDEVPGRDSTLLHPSGNDEPLEIESAGKASYYLYFTKKKSAQDAAEVVRIRGYEVDVQRSASTPEWLLLAKPPYPMREDDLAQARDYFEGIADQFGGEYDGWEVETEGAS
jgi:hypothetical protein